MSSIVRLSIPCTNERFPTNPPRPAPQCPSCRSPREVNGARAATSPRTERSVPERYSVVRFSMPLKSAVGSSKSTDRLLPSASKYLRLFMPCNGARLPVRPLSIKVRWVSEVRLLSGDRSPERLLSRTLR